MKTTLLIFAIIVMTSCFSVNLNIGEKKKDVMTPVPSGQLTKASTAVESKVEQTIKMSAESAGNLKWDCYTCARSCAYTGFPYYCADVFYCVCSYLSYGCPVQNICA